MMKAEDVKVGMTVRVKTDVHKQRFYHHTLQGYLGRKGTITSIIPFSYFDDSVTLDIGGNNMFDVNLLEPVSPEPKFKVGDSVRIISENDDYTFTKIGSEGVVVAVHWEIVGVKFDKYTGERKPQAANTFNIRVEDLEKVEKPEPSHIISISTPVDYGIHGISFSDKCYEMFSESIQSGKKSLYIDWGHSIEKEKEMKDLEKHTLEAIEEQLRIKIVAKDGSGPHVQQYVLKDGRIGHFAQSSVKIELTEDDQLALISKLPARVSNRAFLLKNLDISFTSYEFIETESNQEEPIESPPVEE